MVAHIVGHLIADSGNARVAQKGQMRSLDFLLAARLVVVFDVSFPKTFQIWMWILRLVNL